MEKDTNYISLHGFNKLKDELNHLIKVERPEVTRVVSWAASNGDRSENADYQYGKKRLREIDKRLGYLQSRIDSASIIHPEKIVSIKVQIGATVTILTENDEEKTYHILGVDEVDLSKSIISWRSPLGHSLIGSKVGDDVTFKAPSGLQNVEVIKIEYKAVNY